MSGMLDQAKDDLLRRAAETCAQRPGARDGDVAEVVDYRRLYYRQVAHEDLLARDPADIGGPAMAHRVLGEERPQGRAKVRVFTPTVEECGWDPATPSSRSSPTTCRSWSTR
jgi:glutamate dehydrogenase